MYAPGDKVQGQGELRWGTAGPNLGPPPPRGCARGMETRWATRPPMMPSLPAASPEAGAVLMQKNPLGLGRHGLEVRDRRPGRGESEA